MYRLVAFNFPLVCPLVAEKEKGYPVKKIFLIFSSQKNSVPLREKTLSPLQRNIKTLDERAEKQEVRLKSLDIEENIPASCLFLPKHN